MRRRASDGRRRRTCFVLERKKGVARDSGLSGVGTRDDWMTATGLGP